MAKSGAEAALRGYRLQTLYILSRLMNAGSREHLLRPEGKEDLDIYCSGGQLLESVQVKAYASNLTLSHFSPEKDSSFFKRSLSILKANPNSMIKVVSFGPIGPEIEKAWSQDGPERESVRNKLTNDGYTPEEISDLLTIEFSELSESALEEQGLAFLKNSVTAGDSANAFGLLMFWVFIASELKEQLDYSKVIERLTNVGRFVGARSAYHDEWFTSILPLTSIWNSNEVDSKRLAQEFFQGVDARYEHILAGLDVVRSEKLAEIHQKFESSNVVIMHGASGQGKSTLAFRYLHDYAPNDWRFYVDLRVTSDTRQMLRIANALSGHAQAIDHPCMVYIDVSPSDQDWPELVRALSHLTGLRVLVTIREEDWRRATSYRTRFSSEEFELRFDMEEANNLYAQLREPPSQFLAFDEAWSGFGGKGPLMEFMYFLTQKETLKSRIESQIQNLQDRLREGKLEEDELHLLRLVAVASAYEAKLDLRAVVQHLSLSEPSRTIELFTKEYLIRIDENDSTITGLHSVRSNIMLESVLDEVLRSWESVAEECLSLLMENDLEIFLMHAFSRRREDSTALLKKLEGFHPKSWTGVAGIIRALLWLGVRDYTETNRPLIDREYEEWGSVWFFRLDSDLTEIAGDTVSGFWGLILKSLGVDSERPLEEIRVLRASQTSKREAFLFAKTWLERLEPTVILSPRPQDFAGFAQVLFWAAHLQERHIISPMCERVDLGSVIEEVPISALSDLIYALHIVLGDRFDSILHEYRTRVELRFKRETNTFSLEDDGVTVRANFIPDFAYVTDHEESTADMTTISLTLHEEAMYRVGLLRKLLPDRQKYGSQGYGHRLGILSSEHDDSTKAIDASNFYPHWAQRINAYFRLLGNYPHRPATWEEHALQVFELRRQILVILDQLQKALNTFFRKSNRTNSLSRLLSDSDWERFKHLAKARPLLPQSVVDEWGFSGEGFTRMPDNSSDSSSTSGLNEQSLIIAKHKGYIDILHEYFRYLANFASHGMDVSGRTANDIHLESGKEHTATLNLHTAFETLIQLQIDFRKRVGRFIPDADLSRLEDKEHERFRNLWCVWYQFAFHPGRRAQDAVREFVQERDNALKRVKRQIRRKLKEVKKEEFSASIARTDLQHEGESIPCILVDVSSPELYWQAVIDTLNVLQQALNTNSNRSLRYYAIQFWMKHFAIIPLIQGKSLSQTLFVVPTSVLSSGNVLEHLHQFHQEVSDEEWTKLNVLLWDRGKFEPAVRFTEDLVFLSLHASKIGDLCRFPDESGGYDSEVIGNYLQVQSENVREYLQRVYDLGGELLSQMSSPQIDFENRPFLGAAMNILIPICQQIKPAESRDGSEKITVDETGEWSGRLEQLRDHAEQFKLLWIADVLDQISEGS